MALMRQNGIWPDTLLTFVCLLGSVFNASELWPWAYVQQSLYSYSTIYHSSPNWTDAYDKNVTPIMDDGWNTRVENMSMAFHGSLIRITLSGVENDRTILNSLAPERFDCKLRWINLKLILVINGCGISCSITLRWISLDLIDDNSTLVQLMIWSPDATCH